MEKALANFANSPRTDAPWTLAHPGCMLHQVCHSLETDYGFEFTKYLEQDCPNAPEKMHLVAITKPDPEELAILIYRESCLETLADERYQKYLGVPTPVTLEGWASLQDRREEKWGTPFVALVRNFALGQSKADYQFLCDGFTARTIIILFVDETHQSAHDLKSDEIEYAIVGAVTIDNDADPEAVNFTDATPRVPYESVHTIAEVIETCAQKAIICRQHPELDVRWPGSVSELGVTTDFGISA